MPGFATDAAELFAARSVLAEAADSLRAELTRLVAAADDVLGHGWVGAAGSAFARGWHEWLAGAEAVPNALAQIAEALGICAGEYAAAESSSVVMIGRLA